MRLFSYLGPFWTWLEEEKSLIYSQKVKVTSCHLQWGRTLQNSRVGFYGDKPWKSETLLTLTAHCVPGLCSVFAMPDLTNTRALVREEAGTQRGSVASPESRDCPSLNLAWSDAKA